MLHEILHHRQPAEARCQQQQSVTALVYLREGHSGLFQQPTHGIYSIPHHGTVYLRAISTFAPLEAGRPRSLTSQRRIGT